MLSIHFGKNTNNKKRPANFNQNNYNQDNSNYQSDNLTNLENNQNYISKTYLTQLDDNLEQTLNSDYEEFVYNNSQDLSEFETADEPTTNLPQPILKPFQNQNYENQTSTNFTNSENFNFPAITTSTSELTSNLASNLVSDTTPNLISDLTSNTQFFENAEFQGSINQNQPKAKSDFELQTTKQVIGHKTEQTTETTTQLTNKVSENENNNKGFNYRITEFFLNNTRLTILSFLLLLTLGLGSIFSNRLSGFPEVEVKLLIINTIYPGASSASVEKEITRPIEAVIKNVDGVSDFSSNSINSFSNIVITLEEDVDTNAVLTEVNNQVRSVNFPDQATKPEIFIPSTGGSDFVINIFGSSPEKLYQSYQKFKKDLELNPNTAKINLIQDFEPRVVFELDNQKLEQNNVTVDEIISLIRSLGESLPAVSNVDIDNQSQSIITSLSEASLGQLRNLEIIKIVQPKPNQLSQTQQPQPENQSEQSFQTQQDQQNQFQPDNQQSQQQPIEPTQPIQASAPEIKKIKLEELGSFVLTYEYVNSEGKIEKNQQTILGFENKDNQSVVTNSLALQINTKEGADLTTYSKFIKETAQNISGLNFFEAQDLSQADLRDVNLVINQSIEKENTEQVNQVVGGLIGGELPIDKPLSYFGFLLGGIQLVFLVSLFFVSWRTAVVSALAIPLSLIFSTIYLAYAGITLNTLTLFSLVLVIGLVVDPALVMLESIQRKFDTGLRGKDAVLKATTDVGSGVFLAALTNVIVFVPFGIISGFIGQIFRFIPITIIPAIIGSYVIPLVFLSWLGSLFLKPSKGKTVDEIENLWWIARKLISLNRFVLKSPAFFRFVIIAFIFAVSLSTAGYFVANGQVVFVQFAQDNNSNELLLTGEFLPKITSKDKLLTTKQVINKVLSQDGVFEVNQFNNSFAYRITLKQKDQRGENSDINSLELADKITKELEDNFVQSNNPKFFDLQVAVISTGPPTASYQVDLAVKTDDLQILETASKEVGSIFQKVCQKGNDLSIDEACENGRKIIIKVDDGYTGKENKVVEILLNRTKLQEKGLIIPSSNGRQIPLTALVNTQIRGLFEVGGNKPVGQINLNGEQVKVVLEQNQESPNSFEQIKNLEVVSLTGQKIKLEDVADINQTNPKASIFRSNGQIVGRVKARLDSKNANNQSLAINVANTVVNYFNQLDGDKTRAQNLGLEANSIEIFQEGDNASVAKSFQELGIALVLAIAVSYVVLAVFFGSLGQPLGILYTIPITFIGVFPGLAYFAGGQLGFLEIIGIIILVGIVENVAIFLIDSARQIKAEGKSSKEAISLASGLRFRPVLLTTLNSTASLAPLAILSPFYRSISVVIISGILSSGLLSLITTPILYIFFNWLSRVFQKAVFINKFLFIFLPILGGGLFFILAQNVRLLSLSLVATPIVYLIYWGLRYFRKEVDELE
jgi:HAE1 family hydrophobic/amphiphilic exporter-1